MSIEFLRTLATRHTPLDLTRPDDIHKLVVLRAAGFVTAFTLRPKAAAEPEHVAAPAEVGRFLALTPEGRQALDGEGDRAADGAPKAQARPAAA